MPMPSHTSHIHSRLHVSQHEELLFIDSYLATLESVAGDAIYAESAHSFATSS
jgi:hypothetical protein